LEENTLERAVEFLSTLQEQHCRDEENTDVCLLDCVFTHRQENAGVFFPNLSEKLEQQIQKEQATDSTRRPSDMEEKMGKENRKCKHINA
jgi:hypothetical protein